MLHRALYGLVQTSHVFYKHISCTMCKLGFQISATDRCLMKRDGLIVGLYVDDMMILGRDCDIEVFEDELKNEYKLRSSSDITSFIGCELIWDRKEKSVIIHETDIIEKLVNDFEPELAVIRDYATPAPPHTIIFQPHDDAVMNINRQKKYRHGVGTLLYLIKLSLPDLANCNRELTKVMMKGSEADYKLLLRSINFLHCMRNWELKFHPVISNSTWVIDSYIDADWEGDLNTRKIVSGWVIFMNNAMIAWALSGKQCIATSSSENEYVGIYEICKVPMFTKNVLTFLGITIQLPMVVQVDNVGAIYLAEGGDGKRTKHIDIRYHFVRQYAEDGVVQIVFVKSGENVADVFTKNTAGHVYIEHNKNICARCQPHIRASRTWVGVRIKVCCAFVVCSLPSDIVHYSMKYAMKRVRSEGKMRQKRTHESISTYVRDTKKLTRLESF